MKINHDADTHIQELDSLGSDTCSRGVATQLMARIARRPGRWRRRMQSRPAPVAHEDETMFFDEAA